MNWIPLAILAGLHLFGLGIVAAQHGKPNNQNSNIFISLSAVIVDWTLILWAVLH